MITALEWGFCCAVIGVTVVTVFGQDDTPLKWYFKWAFAWQERGGWRSWITSPIGGCVLCTSGQLALWSYLIVSGVRVSITLGKWFIPITHVHGLTAQAAFLHLLAGCSGVLCAFAINKAYKWTDNQM